MDQLNVNTDGWEIAADRLNLREHIGKGAFGSVWRASQMFPNILSVLDSFVLQLF